MSKRLPFIDFRAVKAAVTMEQVLDHYGLLSTVKPVGDDLIGRCPIHKGSNPIQFHVSTARNSWSCMSPCHFAGNALDFVMRMERCDLSLAAAKLAHWFTIPLPETKGSRVTAADASAEPDWRPPRALAPQPDRSRATPTPAKVVERNKPLDIALNDLDACHPYFAERGVTPETVAEFGLGLCNSGTTQCGRIAIPIQNAEGQLVAYAGRWPGKPPNPKLPKYLISKGFRRSLEVFNFHRAIKEPPAGPLIIVENFFDTFRIWGLGHRKVVALMGNSLSDAQEILLLDALKVHRTVLVLLDEDEAGRTGRADIAFRLAHAAFVGIHAFLLEGMKPEHLTATELAAILA